MEEIGADRAPVAVEEPAAPPAPAIDLSVVSTPEVLDVREVAEPEPEPDAVDVVEPEPEPVVLEPEPEPELPAEERRSSALRIVRPASGTPVAPAADDDVEGVRIIGPVSAAKTELEPEVAAEPEPEPEPEPVAVMPEPQPEPERAPEPVDGLFARLRADRAEKVANAEAVLAATVEEPAPTEVDDDDEVEPDLGVLAARDASVADAERALLRSLKRALADEQNEVLDALRRLKGRPSVDALLPDVAVHDARYGTVLGTGTTAAATAGGDEGAGGAVADALGRALAGDLRVRIDRSIDDAGGDVETLAEAISSTYREWKTARAEGIARDAITAGYAAGTYAAASGDLRWIVDPAEGGCPDCDDNALAGPTPKGKPFPTGQAHPPAHAGCRCLAVPAR
jgi:hypothetical protein